MNVSRPWLKSYPANINEEIEFGDFRSIIDLVDQTCNQYSTLPAFTNMGHSISFRELQEQSVRFAAFLQKELGLKKGDRIAIQMPNLLQYPIALFGALRAGLVVVNTNPLYTAREMRYQFIDSGVAALVILENFADKLDEILAETPIKQVILTEVGDLLPGLKRPLVNFVVRRVKKMVPVHRIQGIRFRDALERGSHLKFEAPELGLEDLAFLQYTGGTTGISKGAMLVHANVLANLLQISEWFKPLIAGFQGMQPNLITALPLYHIFSLTVNCLGLMRFGVNNILITNPKDIPEFFKTLKAHPPHVMTAVSTLLGAMVNHENFRSVKWDTLRITVAGGMALKQSVAEQWKNRTGTPVIEGYGLTETSPVVCANPTDGTDRLGTIGIPLPSTDVRLVNDNGEEVTNGQEGELCVKGPQVMRGYWNRDEETAQIMLPGGWLRTGDVAVMEADGFFRIVDRKKDMILVSGFNVYPNEVEEVAMQHPGVLEAAAVGMADAYAGESVHLFVVPKDPALTEEEVKAHCRRLLTAYKCPKLVTFRKELPKTNVGKILRRALKEKVES